MADEAIIRILTSGDPLQPGGATAAGGLPRDPAAASDILRAAWDDLAEFEDELREAKEDRERQAFEASMAALDKEAIYQQQIDEAMEETANAIIDAKHEKQNWVPGQEPERGLEAFFKAGAGAAKSGLEGDIGGAIKGVTGKGGMLEAVGISSEALAAAAGPVGIALLAKEVVDKSFDAIVGGVETATKEASKAITGDFAGLLDDFNTGVDDLLDKASWISPLFAGIAKVGFSLIVSIETLTEAFLTRAKQLQQFSGPLAQSFGQQEIRQMMADIQEADILGPNMARLVDDTGELSRSFQREIIPLKAGILEVLIPLVQAAGPLLKDGVGLIENTAIGVIEILKFVEHIEEAMPWDDGKKIGSKWLQHIEDEIMRIRGAVDKPKEPKAMLDDFFKIFEPPRLRGNVGPGNQVPLPAQPALPRGMDFGPGAL